VAKVSKQAVRFPAAGADPPTLEGELWAPDLDTPVPGVVVAHPHPQRGGSMHNNVVVALCEGLHASGIASLRFNFRGVGGSGGTYDDGVGEQDDVLGALGYLVEQPGIAGDSIGLAGYSFGARVSLAVASDAPRVRALLCVAPPLREPVTVPCPFFVLVGDRDQNLSVGVEAYASYLPDPTRLRVVQGTDHFWRGFESILAEGAEGFFADILAAPPAKAAS
jgi:alpha/beta superfamily hydrolase